jgi:DNA repair photolyase
VADVSAAFSIGTLDEDAWRRTEPGTPHPRARMEAVAALNRAGVPTGVLIAPVLPGITDRPRMLRQVVEAAIEAGATHVSPILLHLRPGVREEFLPWLRAEYPDLVTRYEQLYPRSYAPAAARRELAARVSSITRALGGLRPSEPPSRWRRDPAPDRADGSREGRARQLSML